MTELLEALRTFLVDEGYWAVIISIVSVGGGGYLVNKAKSLITILLAQLPSIVKDVMLKSLNVDEATAAQWQVEIQESKEARQLLLEKELADIELKIGSPLLTPEQKIAYEDLRKKVIAQLAKVTQLVTDEAVNAIKNTSK